VVTYPSGSPSPAPCSLVGARDLELNSKQVLLVPTQLTSRAIPQFFSSQAEAPVSELRSGPVLELGHTVCPPALANILDGQSDSLDIPSDTGSSGP
jgi:hypothetical protein